MNKKLIATIISLVLIIPVSAQAAPIQNKSVSNPTVVILDTALDTSLPVFKDRIIFEACVIQWASCPNGMTQMEGQGSSTLPLNVISKNGFDHGTQMSYLAVATNPNINIVFVRVIGSSQIGLRQVAGEQTVYNALDWVLKNKDRFNIQAVSMSQGHHNLGVAGTDYCPKTPITENKIKELLSFGVPVFTPTGNSRDYQRIDWPACIPAAIAIGATMPEKSIAIYSNNDDSLVDFYAQGTIKSVTVGGKEVNVGGTSASTVIAATSWATIKNAKPELTYQQVYDLISQTSILTFNSKVKSGKLIDLQKALNG